MVYYKSQPFLLQFCGKSIEPQYVGVYNRTLDSRFGRRKNPSRREPTDPSIIPFFGLSGRQPDRLRQDRRTASPLR
jgi:hypothetical protein